VFVFGTSEAAHLVSPDLKLAFTSAKGFLSQSILLSEENSSEEINICASKQVLRRFDNPRYFHKKFVDNLYSC